MSSGEIERSTTTTSDTPRRVRPTDLSTRYLVSARTAGDWLRSMHAAGAIKKVRNIFMARWSTIDAWVEGGGKMPTARRRGAR